MVESAIRTYAGKTAFERTADRRRALLSAAFDLIAEDGFAQLRIERICNRAGLNKRYFYESFTGTDAITAAVLEQLAAEAITVTLAAMDTSSPRPEFIHAAVRALVHHTVEDPRRARVLFGETPGGDAAARPRSDAIHQIVAAAAAEGRLIHHLENEPDPLIELASTLLVGGTSRAMLDLLDGRLHEDVDRFIDDLARLWLLIDEGTAALASARGTA